MRRAMEFVLRVKAVYTMSELKRIDFVTFFQMLDECEQAEREAAERLEKSGPNEV